MNSQNKDFIRLKVFREVGKTAEDMVLPALEDLESAGMLPGSEAKHEIDIRATVWSRGGRFGIEIRPRQTRTIRQVPPPRHALLDVARPSLPGLAQEDGGNSRTPGLHAGVTPRVWKPQPAFCQLCGANFIMHTGNQCHCPACIAKLGHKPGAERDAVKAAIRRQHAVRLKLVEKIRAVDTEPKEAA